jgi:cyclin B
MDKINNSDICTDHFCTHKEKTKSADVSPKSKLPIKLIIKNKNNKGKIIFEEKNNKKNKSLVLDQNKRKAKGVLKLSMNINQNKSKNIDKGKYIDKDKDKDKDKNNKKVSFASSKTVNLPLKKEPINKNPQIVEEYFDDIYKYLKSIENSDLPKENYMKDVQKDINEKMRKILLDWLIDVHAKFNLLPETLFLTISIIDRYLSKKSINRKYLQLLGVTAMFLCSKYEDIYPPEVKDFIFMTDNAYTQEELVKLESDILEKIQFNMTYPTSLRFLEIFKKILNLKEIDFNRCRYLIEIALFDYHCCHFSPSLIAATCVYFNYRINKYKNKHLKLIESKLLSSIEYDLKDITPCLNCLIKAFKQMSDINNSYTSINRKFAKKEYMKISSEKIDINNIFVNNIK